MSFFLHVVTLYPPLHFSSQGLKLFVGILFGNMKKKVFTCVFGVKIMLLVRLRHFFVRHFFVRHLLFLRFGLS